MKITYQPKTDSAYIYFKEGETRVRTIQLNEDIALDYGDGEKIVGIEILSASEYLGFRKESPSLKLENLTAVI